MSDLRLILLMVGMHVLALAAAGALIVFAVRGGNEPPPTGDDGSGGTRRPIAPPPRGGPPLANARPAQLRLRGPGRLAHAYKRDRRRAAEPPDPARLPVRELDAH